MRTNHDDLCEICGARRCVGHTPPQRTEVDAARALFFFDRWHAFHKRRCGVEDLEVERVVIPGESRRATRLRCPQCRETIQAVIRIDDYETAAALLTGQTVPH